MRNKIVLGALVALMGIGAAGAQAAVMQGCGNSTGTKQVTKTIVVKAGSVYDGACRTFNATKTLGDGSSKSGQQPVFLVMPGATLKNVIIGSNGADGIHVHQGTSLDRINWLDVGNTGVTVVDKAEGSGSIKISNVLASNGHGNFIVARASSQIVVDNCSVSSARFFRGDALGTSPISTGIKVSNCTISTNTLFSVAKSAKTSTALAEKTGFTKTAKVCDGYAAGTCKTDADIASGEVRNLSAVIKPSQFDYLRFSFKAFSITVTGEYQAPRSCDGAAVSAVSSASASTLALAVKTLSAANTMCAEVMTWVPFSYIKTGTHSEVAYTSVLINGQQVSVSEMFIQQPPPCSETVTENCRPAGGLAPVANLSNLKATATGTTGPGLATHAYTITVSGTVSLPSPCYSIGVNRQNDGNNPANLLLAISQTTTSEVCATVMTSKPFSYTYKGTYSGSQVNMKFSKVSVNDISVPLAAAFTYIPDQNGCSTGSDTTGCENLDAETVSASALRSLVAQAQIIVGGALPVAGIPNRFYSITVSGNVTLPQPCYTVTARALPDEVALGGTLALSVTRTRTTTGACADVIATKPFSLTLSGSYEYAQGPLKYSKVSVNGVDVPLVNSYLHAP